MIPSSTSWFRPSLATCNQFLIVFHYHKTGRNTDLVHGGDAGGGEVVAVARHLEGDQPVVDRVELCQIGRVRGEGITRLQRWAVRLALRLSWLNVNLVS